MVKIELKQEEVRELLESMSASSAGLADMLTSIQSNFRYLKECPGIETQATVESFWRLHRCLRGILTKDRFSIEEL